MGQPTQASLINQMDGSIGTRVSKSYESTWHDIGIANALSLTLSHVEKHKKMMKTIDYFLSDALNYLFFGHAPMTPTLMDVVMITSLGVHPSCPYAFSLEECKYKIVEKPTTRNWNKY
ncbi:hypothetical protein BS78_05G128300 [Paspalum vaginatum]|nr:hypothetical protein BS78_05G128300 [Paspalum vaginatum]